METTQPKYNAKQLLAFHYLNDPNIRFVAYGGAAGGGLQGLSGTEAGDPREKGAP